jgi:Na+/pantothenate symporter
VASVEKGGSGLSGVKVTVTDFNIALVVFSLVVILYGSSGYRASVGGDPL